MNVIRFRLPLEDEGADSGRGSRTCCMTSNLSGTNRDRKCPISMIENHTLLGVQSAEGDDYTHTVPFLAFLFPPTFAVLG